MTDVGFQPRTDSRAMVLNYYTSATGEKKGRYQSVASVVP